MTREDLKQQWEKEFVHMSANPLIGITHAISYVNWLENKVLEKEKTIMK